jgi:hypothetical protein
MSEPRHLGSTRSGLALFNRGKRGYLIMHPKKMPYELKGAHAVILCITGTFPPSGAKAVVDRTEPKTAHA